MSRDATPALRVRGLPPSNVEIVADAMREAIVKGRLAPGDRIKEVPLAEQLGISRGPVREAIRLLEHDGLLTLVPNRGAVVPEVKSSEVLEVYAVRATLGSLALHKLMLDDGAELKVLEPRLERLERAVKDRNAPQAAEADLLYQSAIVELSGLPLVAKEFDQLTWKVRIFIATLDIHYDDALEQMLAEVSALHEALVGRDATLAQTLWREKFERWVRDFVREIADDFDQELWAALTSGPDTRPRRKTRRR